MTVIIHSTRPVTAIVEWRRVDPALPACNNEAMNLHLTEIAAAVGPAAHAVLLVAQAGWHISTRHVVPANVTIIALPPKCPELTRLRTYGSSCETNGFRTEFFKSYDDLVDHCCEAWTSSSISLGASCPSDCANGRTSSQRTTSATEKRSRTRVHPCPRRG